MFQNKLLKLKNIDPIVEPINMGLKIKGSTSINRYIEIRKK